MTLPCERNWESEKTLCGNEKLKPNCQFNKALESVTFSSNGEF